MLRAYRASRVYLAAGFLAKIWRKPRPKPKWSRE